MFLPADVANQVLAVLVNGSGYTTMTHVASAMNDLGRKKYGLDLGYDHKCVKRWLQGRDSDQPDLLAEVLATAWGADITPALIWPHTRNGNPPLPAHHHPIVATRTLQELATLVRRDMLCTTATLTNLIPATTGPAYADATIRWHTADTIGLPTPDTTGTHHIDTSTIDAIDTATTRLVEYDQEFGGMLARDGAVGHLKTAVDLLHHTTYDTTTGNRLLATIATLAAAVGRMSHDAGLDGPAQHYLTYALHAARESTHHHAPLTSVGILADMARHLHTLNQPQPALRLVDHAISILPGQHTHTRAMLWNLKAHVLAATPTNRLSEIRGMLDLAANLHTEADDEPNPEHHHTHTHHRTDADHHREAASTYLHLATIHPTHAEDLANHAETETLTALATYRPHQRRERAHSHIDLAHARHLKGHTEQAHTDTQEAIRQTTLVPGSTRLRTQLHQLLANTAQSERTIGNVPKRQE
ncbi:hypothetical protein ACN28C_25190 [Plantactinospora sp. WMMC1484]|uniref:hypothetical protein n=1 Tax=Plantactinospora sp. WMMC1484 TaxID=3404122 RepID=UPI003BF47666